MSDEALRVYRASGRVRNGTAESLLDRILAEAPPRELPRRPEPRSPCAHDQPPARPPGGGAPPADRLVPVASLGERLRAAHRVALVVHEADVLQPVEGLLA